MKKEEFKDIIKKIQAYTDYIYLHVKGEPLLHPQINELIEIANQANLKVNLTTNGTLLENLENRKIRQINYSIQSCENSLQIKEIIRKLKQIQKESDTYISLRLWRKNTKENKAILKVLQEEFPNMEKLENKRAIDNNIFLSIEEEFEWPCLETKLEQEEGYCYGLKDHIAILVDGTVVPCCLDQDGIIALGNILKEDLDVILNNKRAVKIQQGFQNRKAVEPLCQKCQFKLKFKKGKILE